MTGSHGSRPRVLLLVSGGIAAYKSCLLARLLVQAGFSVRCAMTDAAQRFVGPVTFRALTGHGVATDLWGEGDTDPLDHVELARWADVAVVAPATANILAKHAHGIADDIVSTLLLAFDGPLVLAPAMNDVMWNHAATRANMAVLRERGALVVEPGSGWLACGVVAEGRMAEPELIAARVREAAATAVGVRLPAAAGPLAGRRVVVTAGPTRERLDPVRYLSNRSTGTFGFALAGAAAALGADVELIHGPVDLTPPRGVGRVTPVESAADMAAAVAAAVPSADLLIMAAAVADFTPAEPSAGKIKKESLGTSWAVPMARTRDILAQVVDRAQAPRLKVCGFALETDDLLSRARSKMEAKGMDWVVANDPTGPDGAFGPGLHRVHLLDRAGGAWDSGPQPKDALAAELVARLAAALGPEAAS
ncbi:MAG TPA: bifunctional phosphopantothenoylcysteine decarboxylase/phosphopantothenate--cysteine ligase CoaBC [Candidatus Krumholzibacteria bacterium]|nr:bifunctional phosphopantothenoylcysteine decarboxylase/phosphopantothenate--cysteine ligase CoaBC [Candidatus Krumholzibacteria bacterium]HRX50801.1 bifunctional phosphopantothenoylcysteine decarboxylase/phosphopantothenate--cysteine ligase CoaBC [Candidatus Krumholzibacteria bacterium]